MTTNNEKLTPKQEAYCLKYVETGNASEAYRQTYNAEAMKPETVHRKAAELMSNGKITARIEALQEQQIKRHNITVDNLLEELEEARKMAETNNNPNAMIGATMGKAKLLGFDKQKVEVNTTGPIKDFSEWVNEISRKKQQEKDEQAEWE